MSAPPGRTNASAPRPLLIALAVLVVLSLAPTTYTRWVGGMRGPLVAMLAPLSGPASSLAAWLRTDAETSVDDGPLDVRMLKSERDRYARLWLQAVQEADALRALVRDLQRGVAYPARIPVKRIEAKRIGRDIAAGTIDVNRGRRHGVSAGATAVARSNEQLLGVVSRASELTSVVTPITEASIDPPLLVGVVMGAQDAEVETLVDRPRCQLRPLGDGTLVDRQFPMGAGGVSTVELGDVVRLNDEAWPSSAQMLVLGRVEAIRPTDRPLFVELVVRPTADLSRQRSLFLQFPVGDDGGAP